MNYQVIEEYKVMGFPEMNILYETQDKEEAEEILEYVIKAFDKYTLSRLYIDVLIKPKFTDYTKAKIYYKSKQGEL